MKSLQKWKQTAFHNKALVLTSILVAFGTAFYAFAAACQVSIMHQASKDSAAQVERLTAATNAAIKSAVDADSKSITDATASSIDELKTALSQNRDALIASERQSKAALNASIDAYKLDQRPWLEVDTVEFSKPIERVAGGQLQTVIHFTVRNVGKSPAQNVSVNAKLVAGNSWLLPQFGVCKAPAGATNQRFGSTIFPGKTGEHGVGLSLTDSEIQAGYMYIANTSQRSTVNGNDIMMNLVGCIEYSFSFAPTERHQTGFVYNVLSNAGTTAPNFFFLVPTDRDQIQPANLALQFDVTQGSYAN